MCQIKKIIKNILTGAIIVFLLLNVGCWDLNEVEDITLMIATGFDFQPEEELISYTSHLIRPAGLAGEEEGGGVPGVGPVWISTSTGKNIFEASLNLAARSSRVLFEAHSRISVVGEELARQRVNELVDFLIRRREQRLNSWMLVAREGTAAEVLQAEPELEDTVSQEIEGIIDNQQRLSTAPRVQVREFVSSLIQPGKDSFAPVLEVREEIQPPEEDFLAAQPEGKTKKYIVVQGTAVFSGDKLAGYLTVPETKGLLWVQGEVGRAVIIPEKPDGGQVTVFISRARSSLEPKFKEDKLKIKIEIETEGDIGSSNIREDISDPLVIEKLESKLANNIKQEVLLAFDKSQEYQSDFLHLGAAFRREDPQKWAEVKENWRQNLSEVEVEVRVITELRRTGLTTDPVIREE